MYKTINVRQTYLYAFAMEPKDLRIPNGQLEAVNRRRTDNTMITIRKINRHTIVEKTRHRQPKNEQQKSI